VRLKQAVAPSVRTAGGYCECVLSLAAGALHRRAEAVEAMTDHCREFQD
jgi:hypothetical protein